MLFNKKKKQKKTGGTLPRKLITVVNPKAVVSEQFKTIRTNVNFSLPAGELRTMLFTSSTPGEGKSTVSSNTAVVFAQEGKKVLLIDADMRKPTAHHTFGLKNTLGLSNVLVGQAKVEKAIQKSEIPGLDILTSGPIPPNPAELLASQMLMPLVDELLTKYDLVIFDAPPILSVTDAQILSNKCDGTILVVDSGHAQKDGVLKAKEALEISQAKILGVVLNNFKLERDHYYYQYYGTTE